MNYSFPSDPLFIEDPNFPFIDDIPPIIYSVFIDNPAPNSNSISRINDIPPIIYSSVFIGNPAPNSNSISRINDPYSIVIGPVPNSTYVAPQPPVARPNVPNSTYVAPQPPVTKPRIQKAHVEKECVICMNAPATCMFSCNHVSMCEECSKPLDKCPICRSS